MTKVLAGSLLASRAREDTLRRRRDARPNTKAVSPGTYTVSLTVTDNAGCSTAFVFTGQTASCNGNPAAATTRTVVVPATVSKLKVTPKKFSLAGRTVNGKCVKPTSKNAGNQHCKRRIGLKVSYTLDGATIVTFTLKRNSPGRKVNGKCVKQTGKNKHKKLCMRLVKVSGNILKTDKLGASSFTFNGKLGGHKLGPGTYQLTATPTGGKPQTVTFKITS